MGMVGLAMADKECLMISIDDIGRYAAEIFTKPELQGKTIQVKGDCLTGPQITKTIGKYKDATIAHFSPTDDQVKSAVGDLLMNMFIYYREAVDLKKEACEECPKFDFEPMSFDKWCEENAEKIPMV